LSASARSQNRALFWSKATSTQRPTRVVAPRSAVTLI